MIDILWGFFILIKQERYAVDKVTSDYSASIHVGSEIGINKLTFISITAFSFCFSHRDFEDRFKNKLLVLISFQNESAT